MLKFMHDEQHMRRALILAARARGRTSPNPMVGAVLLKGGRVLAEDYHRRAGTPHAEALVIAHAGSRARGATLYVTLEPCSHRDKRTPPCADAVVSAGIARVVAAMQDPNPKVHGRGFRLLRQAGIEVSVGLLEGEARVLNEPYVKHAATGLPLVTLKTAATLDGKIAAWDGESKWITGERARRLVHRTRSHVDALLSGIGTVLADDPRFTARVRGGRDPLRVIIDPSLRIPPDANVLKTPPATLLVTRTRGRKAERLRRDGVEFLSYEGDLDLRWLMGELGSRGIMSVLIEGGSTLNAHALNAGIVDRVMYFIAPKILGGRESFPAVGGDVHRNLRDAFALSGIRVRRVGDDILVEGRLND